MPERLRFCTWLALRSALLLFLCPGMAQGDSTALATMPAVTVPNGLAGQPCRYEGDPAGTVYGSGAVASEASTGALLTCQSGTWHKITSSFGAAQARTAGVVYYADAPGLLVTIPLDQSCICGNYHYVMTGSTSNPVDIVTHVKSYSHYGSMATGTTPIAQSTYYKVQTYYGAAPLRILFYPIQ